MSCGSTEDIRIISKYSTFPGEVPTIPLSNDHTDGTWLPTDLYVGETFYNVADGKSWFRGSDGIYQIGATGGTLSFTGDYIRTSGGTATGPIYAPTFSALGMSASYIYGEVIEAMAFTGSHFGDGSGLYGITATWDGGIVANPSTFQTEVYLDGTTQINGNITATAGQVNFLSDIDASGYAVTATQFFGDGSGLTNLPIGTYSNYYTIAATLSGTEIIFTRTDAPDAYRVDLSPIVASNSISSMDWDGTSNTLSILLNDGSVISENILDFQNITSYSTITAPEFYGGDFYGTFHGTFSGATDIYTISATLSGTEAVFQRNDGASYSLDLSSLSGGGATPSLSQVLNVGNATTGNDIALTGNIPSGETDYILAVGNAISAGFNFEYDSGTTWYPRMIAEDGGDQSIIRASQGQIDIQTSQNILGVDAYTRIRTTPTSITLDGEDLISGDSVRNEITSTTHIVSSTNPSFAGIQYLNDYSANFTGLSLVTKDWVQSEMTLGLIDTYGTRTDKVFADASPGMRTGMVSDDAPMASTGSVFVDPDGAYLSALDNDYSSTLEVTNEMITMKAGSTNLATDYTEWNMSLGVFYKNFVSTALHPGDDDKLQLLERSQSWTFDADYSGGSLVLFYDNYFTGAVMDYEIDFFIRSQSASGKLMTYKIRKNGYYDGSNTFYPILPTDTQKGTDDASYNGNWDIVIQGTAIGDRYDFYWDSTFADGYTYTITAHIKTKQKKY